MNPEIIANAEVDDFLLPPEAYQGQSILEDEEAFFQNEFVETVSSPRSMAERREIRQLRTKTCFPTFLSEEEKVETTVVAPVTTTTSDVIIVVDD